MLAFALSACESTSVGSETNQEIFGKVDAALAAAMVSIYAQAKVTGTTSGVIDKSGPGWIASGSYTYNTATYVFNYNVTFTWSGYTHDDVKLNSGTVNVVLDMDTPNSLMTYTYNGNFEILYLNVQHDIDWDIDLTVTDTTASYTGFYSVDGEECSYSYSGPITAK